MGAAQTISTFAGNGLGGVSGDGGPATAAEIGLPVGGIFDRHGNFFFTTGLAGNTVRKILPSGTIITIAGNGTAGFGGDGGPATNAELSQPCFIALDTVGNLYIPDALNNRIRKVDTFGVIRTIAGTGADSFSGDGGAASAASLDRPICVSVDIHGNIYIGVGARVTKIDMFGIIHTVVGTGHSGYSGDGGRADSAEIGDPFSILTDSSGNFFISDGTQYAVRKVDVSTGIIRTIVGTGVSSYSGDGIHADSSNIFPWCSALDASGNLFIAEQNQRIRKIDTNGIISTIAGTGIAGYNGDGGLADTSEIHNPEGLCLDQCGNLYVSDESNHRIRKIIIPPGSADTPHISITATASDTICHGTTVVYTSSVTGGGGALSYQWYKNNIAISGATNSTYSYAPAPSDSVQCIVSAASPCHSAISGYSNVIVPVFSPVVTPTISITAHPGDTVCEGSLVSFTATITGGGTAPTYQWVVNGAVMGTGSTFSFTPSTGDSVYCSLTSNATCASPAVVKSAAIHLIVTPAVRTTVTVAAFPGGAVCTGTPVVFTAVATSGGSAPRYNWWVNGASAGSGSTYTYPPLNGDSIVCTMVSNIPCASPDTATSNLLIMAVDTLEVPEISISAPLEEAIGSIITVTATVVNAGSAFTIEWMNHGAVFSTTSTLTTSYLKTDTLDVLTAKVVPADYCYDSSLSSPQTVADNTTSTPILSNAPKNVTCYPNPVTSKLYLTADMSINSVAITDLLGQVALQATTAGEKAAIIDVKELRPGVYFVKVNNLWVVKFIKE